ncbi:Os11g0518200 [Oryza sativa Japonica Group]|uniref:Os11g0518200 protein n=1 Tax=Oryza sativa subsp. japonica TaxID=39947 RepID=A0A0P0Y335_ORYSJ|nr:Os11g0518200 [Oryza sativa Japonica Group]
MRKQCTACHHRSIVALGCSLCSASARVQERTPSSAVVSFMPGGRKKLRRKRMKTRSATTTYRRRSLPPPLRAAASSPSLHMWRPPFSRSARRRRSLHPVGRNSLDPLRALPPHLLPSKRGIHRSLPPHAAAPRRAPSAAAWPGVGVLRGGAVPRPDAVCAELQPAWRRRRSRTSQRSGSSGSRR